MNLYLISFVLVNIVTLSFCHSGRRKIGEPCMHDSECYKGLICKKFCQYPFRFDRKHNIRHKESKEQNERNCPFGWIDYKDTCYFISRYRKTWFRARQDCQRKGGDLLVIDSDIVLDFSIDFFTKFRLSNSYFVGASARGFPSNWKWLNGEEIPSSGYMWSECGTPSNTGGTNLKIVESCATVNFYGLDDITCDSQQFYICSKCKPSEERKDKLKSNPLLLQGASRGLKKCRHDYQCFNGLICTQNMTCGCPDGEILTSNFDKCININETEYISYIASSGPLDFFVSHLEYTWRGALQKSEKFEYNLLMFENSLQLVNFIDLAIKNDLSGTYWIGVFSLNQTATWIDCSALPNGPWLPSFNGCSDQIIGPGLVCFALENFKIVIKDCALRYKALYVKGVKCNILQIKILITKLTTTTSVTSTATTTLSSTTIETTSASTIPLSSSTTILYSSPSTTLLSTGSTPVTTSAPSTTILSTGSTPVTTSAPSTTILSTASTPVTTSAPSTTILSTASTLVTTSAASTSPIPVLTTV